MLFSWNKLIWHLTLFGVFILPWFPALGEIALVISLVLTWKYQQQKIIKQPINWGFFILSIWLILTSCFAFQPTESFLGLANFLPFFALVAAFGVLIRRTTQLKQLAWAIVIPSLPVTLLGLGQLFLHWRIPLTIFGWELVAEGNPEGRMASVFMYANILAAYLLIVFILGLGLGLIAYQNWRRDNYTSQKFLPLGFLAITAIINPIGIVLTSSRNAWAIAILALVAFALYLGWSWLVLGFFGFVSAILWASFGFNPSRDWLRTIIPTYFWARISDQMYPDRPVATLRSTQWQFAWQMTTQHPLTGWGLRSFTPLYEKETGLWLGHPHNLPLMLMAETGIVGVIVFLGLVAWIVAQALIFLCRQLQSQRVNRRRQESNLILFTYLLAFAACVIFNLLDVTIFDLRVNTLGWLLLSGIYSFHQRKVVC